MTEAVDAFLLAGSDELAWETFHENSKTSRHQPHVYFERHPSDATIVATMRSLREVKPYTDRQHVPLPGQLPTSQTTLDQALLGRESARSFCDAAIEVSALAKVLHCAYGETRDNRDSVYPRPFRAVPSGGALYPLELYVWSRRVNDLPAGLYHYDPLDHELDSLGAIDLASSFVQADLVRTAAAVVLVSAVFFRSAFKYGDRGYRFVLLEAGHVVQNAVLAALGIGVAAVPVGGYFDREIDTSLQLDGIDESVVYALLLGYPKDET